jgi:hypothetical protein
MCLLLIRRRKAPDSDHEFDVEEDVSNIVASSSRKSLGGKKVPLNVPSAPMYNVSFHSEASVSRWKYVYNRRVAIKRVETISSCLQGGCGSHQRSWLDKTCVRV